MTIATGSPVLATDILARGVSRSYLLPTSDKVGQTSFVVPGGYVPGFIDCHAVIPSLKILTLLYSSNSSFFGWYGTSFMIWSGRIHNSAQVGSAAGTGPQYVPTFTATDGVNIVFSVAPFNSEVSFVPVLVSGISHLTLGATPNPIAITNNIIFSSPIWSLDNAQYNAVVLNPSQYTAIWQSDPRILLGIDFNPALSATATTSGSFTGLCGPVLEITTHAARGM